MNLKGACRLCCSREEVTYDLFSPCEDGVCLAEELFSLLNIKLIKEDELPESICVNCYRVNTFFKEFKENCSQVDNYLKKTCTKDESAQECVTIKKEKEDDYVDQSIAPEVRPDDDNAGSSETNADAPYPVALLHSINSERLEELQGNFLSAKRTREGEGRTSVVEQRGKTPATEETPTQRREKRKLDEVDAVAKKRRAMLSASYDYANHVVKQEEVDIYDSPFEDSDDADSLEDPLSSQPGHLSKVTPNVRSPSPSYSWEESCSSSSSSSSDEDYEYRRKLLILAALSDPGEDSCSSSSCYSSDSDEDVEMVMLLALLL